jgi:hypothetical protein
MVHRMANNGNMSIRRAVEVWMQNEQDELLAYFPEYKEAFDKIQIAFDSTVEEFEALYNAFKALQLSDRKAQALWILKNARHTGLMFNIVDKGGPVSDRIMDYYKSRGLNALIALLQLS